MVSFGPFGREFLLLVIKWADSSALFRLRGVSNDLRRAADIEYIRRQYPGLEEALEPWQLEAFAAHTHRMRLDQSEGTYRAHIKNISDLTWLFKDGPFALKIEQMRALAATEDAEQLRQVDFSDVSDATDRTRLFYWRNVTVSAINRRKAVCVSAQTVGGSLFFPKCGCMEIIRAYKRLKQPLLDPSYFSSDFNPSTYSHDAMTANFQQLLIFWQNLPPSWRKLADIPDNAFDRGDQWFDVVEQTGAGDLFFINQFVALYNIWQQLKAAVRGDADDNDLGDAPPPNKRRRGDPLEAFWRYRPCDMFF